MKRILGHARRRGVVAVISLLAALFAVSAFAGSALAAFASFPGPPPPVQITRDLTLSQAARAGIVQLSAKGGFEGDDVALQLEGKQVSGPITVTVHVELTTEPTRTPAERAIIREAIPGLEQQTEKVLNSPHYKTKKGEPINFDLDYKFREPGEPADPSYDQVKIVSPTKDLPEPDPDFRSYVEQLGVPNSPTASGGVFSTTDLKPGILAHETLHLAGLDDRYVDVYSYKGRQIPLPEQGLSPKALAEYLKSQKPPVPPPPAGEIESVNTPGTGRCDIMGTGANLACRKISKRDLRWIESQAGVQVEVQPGELLLNKRATDQNLAVGFPTRVIAPRGGSTLAPGVSTYCVDHSKQVPGDSGFDVGPAVSSLPGFSGVEKLLKLNAELQPALDEPLTPLQLALWNVTDNAPLEEEFEPASFTAEARSLLARAGVAENSNPSGLAHLGDPNAAAATTGAVDATGALLPALPAEVLPPSPALTLNTAVLIPSTVAAGQKAHSTLVVGVTGEATTLALQLQFHSGHHWRTVKKLPDRKLESGNTVLPLKLGRLKAGKFRVQVEASGPAGGPLVQEASLTARK